MIFWYLIKENPFKITYVIICTICAFVLSTGIEPTKVVRKVEATFEHNSRYYSIPQDGENFIITDEPLENNEYIYYQTNGLKIVTIICLVIFVFLLIMTTVIPDEDTQWNFNKVYQEYLYSQIKMNKEGSYYYYHLKGKLLKRETTHTTNVSVYDYMNNKNLLEDYIPKRQKRNNFIRNMLS